MKKLALLICVLMLVSMVACATKDNENVGNTGTNGTKNTTGNTETTTGTNNNTETTETKTLTGNAQGYGGEVSVTVKVKGNDIISVEAIGPKETEGVGSKAIAELPGKIEDADSTEVEVVSGATVTSNAIKEAVDKALAEK